MGRLIIDGKRVYEVDEECMKRKSMPLDIQNHFSEDIYDKNKGHSNKEENEGR